MSKTELPIKFSDTDKSTESEVFGPYRLDKGLYTLKYQYVAVDSFPSLQVDFNNRTEEVASISMRSRKDKDTDVRGKTTFRLDYDDEYIVTIWISGVDNWELEIDNAF